MELLTFVFGSALFLNGIFCKSAHNAREARWFGHTYTETKTQTEIVTSLVPSSCVHVEATLPPCRNVRNMQSFPEFVGSQIYPENIKGRQLVHQPKQETAENEQILLAPVNDTTSMGWAEYLGLVAPTVTVTAVNLRTTTVVDPRTVVTFSVKGCRPSRLPMDLDRCPVSQYAVEEILPTAVTQILPTAFFADVSDLNENDINFKKSKNVQIEPSSPELDLKDMTLPTEELSNVDLSKRSN